MHRNLVSPFTWILGLVLALVGVAGFFVEDMLLVFQVDLVHNVIHLVSGIVALVAASRGYQTARHFLIVFGVVYGLVTYLGFTMDGDILGYFSVNMADNYLHAAITAVCLIVGFGTYHHERV
ncbi:MAG: DUF4383 domain-containing protein [Candidatus Peregrinibacteria bacterium]|nr:DUF4383 domain-containing protein [Candidatus Peregrinibacteria bacterium]